MCTCENFTDFFPNVKFFYFFCLHRKIIIHISNLFFTSNNNDQLLELQHSSLSNSFSSLERFVEKITLNKILINQFEL